jgi:hypothetical protein
MALIDMPRLEGSHEANFGAKLLQELRRAKDGMMLRMGGHHHEVLSSLDRLEVGTGDGGVVRFGTAGGERDLAWMSANQVRDRFSCLFDRDACRSPERIDARGIAEFFPEIGQHRLKYFRAQLCGRAVIEIDHARGNSRRKFIGSREIRSPLCISYRGGFSSSSII